MTSSHPWPNCSPLTPTYPHLPTPAWLPLTPPLMGHVHTPPLRHRSQHSECPVCGHRTFHRPVFYILSFTLLACIMLQDVLGNPSKEKKMRKFGGGLLFSTLFFHTLEGEGGGSSGLQSRPMHYLHCASSGSLFDPGFRGKLKI